jgi:hypothetical protein
MVHGLRRGAAERAGRPGGGVAAGVETAVHMAAPLGWWMIAGIFLAENAGGRRSSQGFIQLQ